MFGFGPIVTSLIFLLIALYFPLRRFYTRGISLLVSFGVFGVCVAFLLLLLSVLPRAVASYASIPLAFAGFLSIVTAIYFRITGKRPYKKPQPEPQPEAQIEPPPDVLEEPEPIPVQEPEPVPDGVLVDTDADTNKPLYISDELRGKHLYLIGKTRTGKTTLIKNLIVQTMEQGSGLCSVDPHGDQAEDILSNVPKERIKDVIYFDPTKEWCPAFNFFRLPYPPHKLTEDIISVFQLFFDSWGPRMEHLLRYSCLTLLMSKFPATLFDLRRMLVEDDHRALILSTVEDETIQAFWEHEFPSMGRASADPILNKLSAFLVPSSPMFRLFSQPENGLDFPQMLREQKILIVNLAKGKVGETGSKLLGGMIVAGIQGAGLAQADIAPEKRKPFHLFIDEFQNYAVKSMEDVLSESAKYKLFLTLAHQTLGQISASMQHAILGNVATLVAFQISATDAGILNREMKRTEHLVRERGTRDYFPATDFRAELRKKLKGECLRYNNMADVMKAWGEVQAFKIEKIIELIDDPNTTLDVIKERVLTFRLVDSRTGRPTSKPLLPDYEFLQRTYPDVDGFVNLKPRTAFIRKERAEDVTLFKTNAPPPPVAGIKGKILHNMRELHALRLKARPPTTPKTKRAVGENSAPNANVRTLKKPALKVVPKRKPQAQDYEF